MVNQYNKKRRNLPKETRARKKSFKVATRTDNKGIVRALNEGMFEMAEASVAAAEERMAITDGNDTSPAPVSKKASRVIMVKKGKLGKANSIIKPTLMSKKKVRQLLTRTKHQLAREAAKSGQAPMAIDEEMKGIVLRNLIFRPDLVSFHSKPAVARFAIIDAPVTMETESEEPQPQAEVVPSASATVGGGMGTTLGGPPPMSS
ncbi:hypothetical protein HK104_005993 [Borealophlyctis nickersoniae]|nr:hypothetical protein HK104_005993 [Borealophlyctis nickersoniae]